MTRNQFFLSATVRNVTRWISGGLVDNVGKQQCQLLPRLDWYRCKRVGTGEKTFTRRAFGLNDNVLIKDQVMIRDLRDFIVDVYPG